MEVSPLAKDALVRLARWLDNAPEVSLDPFDIKAHPWFSRRLKRLPRRLDRLALNLGYVPAFLVPTTTRRLLGVPRQQTTGAAAWLCRGYLALYKLTLDNVHLQKAETWLARLRSLRLQNGCWGLPFNWQTSSKIFPANTANLHATQLSSRAFAEHFEVTGEASSLEVAISACEAFLRVTQRLVDSPNRLCLSYAPGDNMQVFNVNALAGGWLCRMGQFAGREDFSAAGKRMLNWVVNGQLQHGEWEYFSRESRPKGSVVDHYHTAMVLQGLLEGMQVFPNCWVEGVERGLQYYLVYLFDQRGRPKMTAENTYPLDVMSCAEGLLVLAQLEHSALSISRGLLDSAHQMFKKLIRWACEHAQTSAGPFYYRQYPLYRMRFDSYRWGQGPMLKALCEICVSLSESKRNAAFPVNGPTRDAGSHSLSLT